MSVSMHKMSVIFLFLLVASKAHAGIMVNTTWLQQHLNDTDLVLIDMSSDQTQYQRFHIPGAIYLGYANLVQKRKKDKVSLRISRQRLVQILGFIGVSRRSHVVIYDDMGGLNAGRLYWELERLKHPRVSVVDGGLVKWILEGRKVENKYNERKKVSYIAGSPIADNVIDLAQIKKSLQTNKQVLLDVRSREEYLGHPRYKRSGHIPGAKLWSWDDTVDFASGFTFKKPDLLLSSLRHVGVTKKSQPLILYCRTGHRAAQTYLVLKQLGFNNILLYDGSMSEYAKDLSAPVRQGISP